MAEITDKQTGKKKPGILFFDAPFKNVLISIEEDGACEILKSDCSLRENPEWKSLLKKRVEDILKSI